MVVPGFGTLTPEDLTDTEVERIVDPGATGVPELSPEHALPVRIRELQARIEQADGEEQLVWRATLSSAIATVDAPKSCQLAQKIIDEARSIGSLHAEAQALAAILSIPPYLMGQTMDERLVVATQAIELFAHLHMPLQQARCLIGRAMHELIVDNLPRQSLETLWAARSLVLEDTSADPLRHECLGEIARFMGNIAWRSERSFPLARRYAAVSILHHRQAPVARWVAEVHLELGQLAAERGDLSAARRHMQRANVVHQHHHQWWFASRTTYWLGMVQLDFGDVVGAKRSLGRLAAIDARISPGENASWHASQILDGFIAGRDRDWQRTIELLEPLLSEHGTSSEAGIGVDTQVKIAQELGNAHDGLGNYKQSIAMLRRALDWEREKYENRLAGGTSGLVLTDELARLRATHGAMAKNARRDATLLRAILPPSAYEEFDRTGACTARYVEHAVVFFSDIVGFTKIAAGMPADQLLDVLGSLFNAFDQIMDRHGCERVETIGDAYLAINGLRASNETEERCIELAMVRSALEICRHLSTKNAEFRALGSPEFVARIGLHSGPVVAGLVGDSRSRFAVVGDTVNTAQRLEAGGRPGRVTISDRIAGAVGPFQDLVLQPRRRIAAKGKGMIVAWEVGYRASTEADDG